MMELSNAKLPASWSELEGNGERAMRRRSCSAGQWRAVALLRRFWRAEEVKEEAERVWKAAARPPLQAGQRAAWSGRTGRV